MGKIIKRILASVLTVAMLITAAPLSGFAGLDLPNLADLFTLKADAATYSGKCGANITWSLDTDTGVLTISGTGDMYYWDYFDDVPWDSNRSSVKTVVIGDSVTSIGNYAFGNCDSLTSVTIPDSVTSIGDEAFYDCNSLTSITVKEGNPNYSSDEYGVLFNKDKTLLIQYPIGNTRTSYAIPDSVTSIGNYAFGNCDSLTSVTIPDSVTSIGDEAFYDCNSLTSITVKEGNPNYSSDEYGVLFNKDKTLLIQYPVGNTRTSYAIPDSVTSIVGYAFLDCDSLTSVTIPDSVTSIGNYAFFYCTGLTSVTIPNSVTSIGNYAFCFCDSLTSVTIGNSVTSIGNYAFFDCNSLTSVTIPDSVTSIGNDVFAYCRGLTSVTIPDSVTSIGNYAFFDCNSLTSVTIPDSVTSIGNYAFCFCDGLTSVTIGNSVTSIGDSAFFNCTGLTSVTIGNSVTSIGDGAFEYCTGLTSVTIPDSVTSIGEDAFYYCTSLTDVYYTGSEEEWQSISIGSHNECLTNATIHYNSVTDSKYTVSFDLNGGLGTLEKQTKKQGEPLTLTSAEPTRTGYIFKNWNTEASGEGMTYLPGSTYNDDKTVVLYAQWEPITYTVRFYDSDTLLDSKVLSYDETGTLSCSFTPEKKGYAFVGWSTVENGPALFEDGIKIKNLSAENGGSVSYYSVWEKIPDKELEDEKTGIQVSAPSGTFDGDVTLKVEEVLSGSSFDIIGKVNGKAKTKVFTIETYVDGQSVQPNGDVTVRIPIPDGFNAEKCKLYYLNTSSKNPEEIAFKVEDGYIVFTTNHFSDWAIVQLAGEPIVSIDDIEMNYKKTATLNTVIEVDEGVNYTVEYSSSNPSVAKVDENGNVYGAKKGSADITVTVTDEYGNTVTDTCNVKVNYSFGQWLIVILLFGWIWY